MAITRIRYTNQSSSYYPVLCFSIFIARKSSNCISKEKLSPSTDLPVVPRNATRFSRLPQSVPQFSTSPVAMQTVSAEVGHRLAHSTPTSDASSTGFSGHVASFAQYSRAGSPPRHQPRRLSSLISVRCSAKISCLDGVRKVANRTPNHSTTAISSLICVPEFASNRSANNSNNSCSAKLPRIHVAEKYSFRCRQNQRQAS